MPKEVDVQKLAVLYFVLALGALFDVNVVPGASSGFTVSLLGMRLC